MTAENETYRALAVRKDAPPLTRSEQRRCENVVARFESAEHLAVHLARRERRCTCAWYLSAKRSLEKRS